MPLQLDVIHILRDRVLRVYELVQVEFLEGVSHYKGILHDSHSLLHQLLEHGVAVLELEDETVFDQDFAIQVAFEAIMPLVNE